MIDMPDRYSYADDDAIALTTCDVHDWIEHPLDQMCHLCLQERLQKERSEAIAKSVADDLVAMIKDIGGGK